MHEQWALESERRLFPQTRVLKPDDPTTAKTLLTRPARPLLETPERLSLTTISSAADWRRYAKLRIEVEAGFGVGTEAARSMVEALRERSARLNLTMFFGRTAEDGVVGAIGHFGEGSWARLQEVDVFPAWRGRGYGDALLAASLRRLADNDVQVVVVGRTRTTGRWPGTGGEDLPTPPE